MGEIGLYSRFRILPNNSYDFVPAHIGTETDRHDRGDVHQAGWRTIGNSELKKIAKARQCASPRIAVFETLYKNK